MVIGAFILMGISKTNRGSFWSMSLITLINITLAYVEVGGYQAIIDQYAEAEPDPLYSAFEWDPDTNTNK